MKVKLPQGLGGGPSNMQSMIKQAQKMQEEMAAKQAELEEREYDISAGGGVVNLKINGKKEILSVKLAEEIVDPDDIETLEDLIVAAVNEAIKKVESVSAAEMGQITGNMNLPGMLPVKARESIELQCSITLRPRRRSDTAI